MRIFFLFFFLLILSHCSKPKTVLICGDHICINKAEAQQYFEENLTIEVKITNKDNKDKIDLVELNLQENKGSKKINIYSREKTKKDLKVLSDKQKELIKKKVKDKENKKKTARIKVKQNEEIKKKKEKKAKKIKKDILKNNNLKNSVNKKNKGQEDICTILKKCNIDEISKYLLNQGKNKKFPDITTRQ